MNLLNKLIGKKQSSSCPPRQVPYRDEFYLGMAFWAASRSKDPNTQCGAFIISKDNIPLGWGYNGPPQKINDNDVIWSRPEKYDFITHAEVNAIHYAPKNLDGSTIYVTGKPCKDCMLHIVRAGISRVVYFPYKGPDKTSMLADPQISMKTEEIARKAGVSLEEFSNKLDWMVERMNWMKSIGIFSID